MGPPSNGPLPGQGEPPDPGERDGQQQRQPTPADGYDSDAHSSIVEETQPSQEVDLASTKERSTAEQTRTERQTMEQAGREPLGGQERTDESSATAEEPKDCTALLEVQPEELFAALVREMKEASETALVDAWKQSAAELFETVFKTVEVKPELVPVGKKRYLRLKGEEASHLLKFFVAVCVEVHGTYTDWVSHITAISRDLYNTSWTLTTILQSSLSKVRWSKAPVLNQWANKVKQGVNHHTTVEGPGAFPAFMFNPRKYTSSDIDRLKGICLQREADRREHKLREGSEDEWAIIQGIAEGNIVSRRLPSFIKSILDSQERLRLCSTIQAQVEGELMFVLHGFTSISVSRQHTRALKEDMLLAAERANLNLGELHGMLSQTKTISFNRVNKSIHLFFFDRATAAKHALTVVPFRGKVYLTNVHDQMQGSAWDRQSGRNGDRMIQRTHYEVRLYNITRFMDIGRLTAYVKKQCQADFELEDLDICTPNSRTSTVWRATFKLAGCPEFLRGVVRLLWFGASIVIKHPKVGRRLQCLRCGNLGHTMARCNYTDSQLRGQGSIVSSEEEVVNLDDLAKPYSSMAEIRAVASKRLELQQRAERATEEAVLPTSRRQEDEGARPPPNNAGVEEQASGLRSGDQEDKQETQTPQPKPKTPWVTVKLKGGRTLFAHKKALDERQATPSRYAALAEEDADADADEGDTPEPPTTVETHPDVIDIASGASQEEPKVRTLKDLSQAEKRQLHIRKGAPPEIPAVAQLVALNKESLRRYWRR